MIIETDDYRLLIPNCFMILVSHKSREITLYHKVQHDLAVKISSFDEHILISLSPRFKIAKLNERNVLFIHDELLINIDAGKPVIVT